MVNHLSERPLKKFSQNFLTNVFYQKKIVQSLRIQSQDTVIEIGPGKGALTEHLLQAKPQRLVVIEIDTRMVQLLKEKFGDRIELVAQDVLKVDFPSFASEHKRLKIIGNLPYHITSPILFRLIDAHRSIERAVLMTQKEVAQRICAKPNRKAYGILSVLSQTYAKTEYLFEIKRGNFFPAPKVDSAVIALDFFKDIPDLDNPQLFRKIVRGVFNYRRKTLKNSLSRIFDKAFVYSLDDALLKKRPEELSVKEFKQLCKIFK